MTVNDIRYAIYLWSKHSSYYLRSFLDIADKLCLSIVNSRSVIVSITKKSKIFLHKVPFHFPLIISNRLILWIHFFQKGIMEWQDQRKRKNCDTNIRSCSFLCNWRVFYKGADKGQCPDIIQACKNKLGIFSFIIFEKSAALDVS